MKDYHQSHTVGNAQFAGGFDFCNNCSATGKDLYEYCKGTKEVTKDFVGELIYLMSLEEIKSIEEITMATPNELAKFYASAPSEDAICMYNYTTVGNKKSLSGPDLRTTDIPHYSWKPQAKAKVIDMSYLVGSDVLCEFGDNEEVFFIDLLSKIDDSGYIRRNGQVGWKHCRPVFNLWQVHTGDTQPVPDGLMVEVVLRNKGRIKARESEVIKWATVGIGDDIIHYRVVGMAEGWVTHE